MLIETIRCESGEALHLPFHQKRLEYSLQTLGFNSSYNLSALITPPDTDLYRCRFLYDQNGYTIEFHPYLPKIIRSLKLVNADHLVYPLKYSNRDALNALFSQRGTSDDILMVKNGFLTDTTIANIALLIDNTWLTPSSPLLKGTTRHRLIEEEILIPYPLKVSDLTKCSKIALMNAMMGFVEVENGIIV